MPKESLPFVRTGCISQVGEALGPITGNTGIFESLGLGIRFLEDLEGVGHGENGMSNIYLSNQSNTYSIEIYCVKYCTFICK